MRKRQMNKRPQIKVVAHFMEIDGARVKVDPFQTDLPDRCKLALAEMTTGQKYELVETRLRKASSS
ncbi:hypothetical protein P4V33_01485 [Brevibacillus borstelensis]|uniref:hypothetical protein n=1 Tax=Brevibacillus borstelensis TaxID=45462 RepID=UPI002E1CA623|nr:hypothetical protein [Brevibacillus borstelensis]